MRSIATVVLVFVLTVPAHACLNDSETRSAEQEFNSAYAGKTSAAGRLLQPTALLILGPPLLLLGLGCYFKSREKRRPSLIQRRAKPH